MQNIQERLTGLWPATGASSRRTARFAVSISASLTAGLTTSVDMGHVTCDILFCVHVCLNFALFRMIKYVVLKFI